MDQIDQNPPPTFDELRTAARQSDWSYVDRNLTDKLIGEPQFWWARTKGLVDPDYNVRDFAATALMVSHRPLSGEDRRILRVYMGREIHDIVRYRLAMALYQRGDRHADTLAVMRNAVADPDVGHLAKKMLNS